MMILIITWCSCLLLAAYLYVNNAFSRFSFYGVKVEKPSALLINNAAVFLRKKHILRVMDELYQKNPNERFLGHYNFMDPQLIITDIELIKKITIQDFAHFIDHKTVIDEHVDPYLGRNLLTLKGAEWKDMRSTLSPAFTSSKLRAMVPFMNEVARDMIRSLKNTLKESDEDFIDVDVKDLSTRFANDVIASCVFGLKVDSHNDKDNYFYKMGKETTTLNFRQLLQFLLYLVFPKLTKSLKLSIFKKTSKDFFKHLVLNTMKDREEKNIIRPDMIHLLMEAKKGKLTHEQTATKDEDVGFATVEELSVGKKKTDRVWSDTDLIAQAILFFVAGLEPVSTATSFLFHELAASPDVQGRLLREVRETDGRCGGRVDYDAIQNMTYLDMVVSELLRLWTPAGLLDRVCVKDYNLGRPNDTATQDYVVRKGEGIAIPAWQIHRDPKYFPDPLKFDPERFSAENKHNIQDFTYMPFGVGPRNCIGSRFALCEVKIMTYQLLKQVELSPAAKTTIPAELGLETFNIAIKGGHWVRITERN